MKILVFDTETTGLPIGRNPSIRETKKWPHIIQLSCILYDIDKNTLLTTYDEIIKVPTHITISEESISLHGISRDISTQKGIPIKNALHDFNILLKQADMVIGHNVSFDKRLIMVESIRLYMSQYFTIDGVRKPEYCTMKNSVELCQLERISKDGEKYFKYPSLTELHDTLFQSTPKSVHNSLVDIVLCLRCYCMMEQKKDIYTEGCENIKLLLTEIL